MKLRDKVAIVTGGSRGIGRAACVGLAQAGARVVVNYCSRPEKAQEVVELISERGGEAIGYQADVSVSGEVNEMVIAAVDHFGGIDILVNNAGIDPRQTWHEMTEEDWDHVLGVNLKGQFLCAKAVYPHMRARGKGKIINVTSVVYFLGFRDLVHYSASKGGIIGLTRALARELGSSNINVNAVAPGAIQTESELEEYPDQEAMARTMAERQCLRQRIRPEDLVGIFVFLASDDSDPITGQTIVVDGGWALH